MIIYWHEHLHISTGCDTSMLNNPNKGEGVCCKPTWMDDWVCLRHDLSGSSMLINGEVDLMARFTPINCYKLIPTLSTEIGISSWPLHICNLHIKLESLFSWYVCVEHLIKEPSHTILLKEICSCMAGDNLNNNFMLAWFVWTWVHSYSGTHPKCRNLVCLLDINCYHN